MNRFVVTVCLVLVLPTLAMAQDATTVWPGKEWQRRTPEQIGIDGRRLRQFAERVKGAGCIIKDGYLVMEWGDPRAKGDWASAMKPVMSTMLMFAVEEGKLTSVDAPVRPFVKQVFAGKDLIAKDRTMTFRHLANMVSGYGLPEKPGQAWGYNDYAINLYLKTLFDGVFRQEPNAATTQANRLGTLQFQDGAIFGSRRGYGLRTTARDFARIGWFWLNKGNWNGKQLLPARYFDHFMRPGVPSNLPRTTGGKQDYLKAYFSGGGTDQTPYGPGIYIFNWWFNARTGESKRLVWPDAPIDAFQANGHWNREVMTIIPSLRLVVAARGNWGRFQPGDRDAGMNKNLKLLVEACGSQSKSNRSTQVSRKYSKWSKIELTFEGPSSRGRADPNPFSIPFDVTFTNPSNKSLRVPGFYDGDGKGSIDGNVWKVRFSADQVGEWKYRTKSSDARLDGQKGRFQVVESSPDAAGFWKWGRLEYTGTPQNGIRYLKFRDGSYWLKAGCDDPENFLGKYANFNSLEKRKAAVDYLAERGVNSLYIMTHNIGGDDRDVWPWLGTTEKQAKLNGGRSARFDVARLDGWHKLFEHMQTRGVVPYLVLEDDSAWKGYDHERYYREMIARFGYLPALCINFNEEANENYRLSESLQFMRTLKRIDPYNHPRGIHNVNRPNDQYVDAVEVDFTSIQTGQPGSRRSLERALAHNQMAIDWIERCRRRKRRILVANFDEGRPEADRRGWWSAYLGGGVWEVHTDKPYDRPYSSHEPTWTQLGGTRAFMESMPFWQMQPNNQLVKSGRAFCLEKPGKVYALYLPTGGTIKISLPDGRYKAAWWNPDNGRNGQFEKATPLAGGLQPLTAPGKGDWAVRITRE